MLTPEFVLRAYAAGFFPMADPRGRIQWLSPDPRGIFELDGLLISRSLRKSITRGEFELRVNTAFAAVMDGCGDRDEGTWISSGIRRVYIELHRRGHAHSVETWAGAELVGGLYGVSLGGAFFGESMFHRRTDASKVALVALVERMRARGFVLLDTQFLTPHLASLGATEVSREEYLKRLAAALELDRRFVDSEG
ncbi:MAG: leucyl/phenylalanyl-tRNA--protein transferase [Planctomycetia bacterium]|nr:MAG: leucyl/phenylalanyl-tRNA--protein transferase [Planctomycetia bacterium]